MSCYAKQQSYGDDKVNIIAGFEFGSVLISQEGTGTTQTKTRLLNFRIEWGASTHANKDSIPSCT